MIRLPLHEQVERHLVPDFTPNEQHQGTRLARCWGNIIHLNMVHISVHRGIPNRKLRLSQRMVHSSSIQNRRLFGGLLVGPSERLSRNDKGSPLGLQIRLVEDRGGIRPDDAANGHEESGEHSSC